MTERNSHDLIESIATLVAELIRNGQDIREIMRVSATFAQQITHASGAVLETVEGDELVYHATIGTLAEHEGLRLQRQSTFSGRALQSGQAIICDDTTCDDRVNRDLCLRLGIRSMIVVPLDHAAVMTGVLKVVSNEPNHFNESDVETVALIGGILSIAIHRAEEAASSAVFERELAASETRWRSVVEQNLSGIYILEDGRFTYANDRFLNMIGYSLEELVGLRDVLEPVVEKDRARTAELLHRRWSGELRNVQYETTCRRKDGSQIVLEIYATTVDTAKGKRIIGTAVDATARHVADDALRRREEWFRSLIEGASDMIWVFTPDGIITYASASVQSHLGYDPASLAGRNVYDFVHASDVVQMRADIAALKPGSITAIRMRTRHANLGWRECDARMRIALDLTGRTIVIVNARDITEQQRMQQQVAEVDRLASLGRVASSMAHEFNNVLMAIQPFADVIKRVHDPERLQAAAGAISNAVRRGRTITQQVLRFTRGEAPDRHPVALREIVDTLEKELIPLLPFNVRLEITIEEGDLIALADAGQIEQLLLNLCLNARDAMPDGGTITLGLAAATDHDLALGLPHQPPAGLLHVYVADTGVGIPEELLPRVFEPLFTTRKAAGGSGLGLTIAQQIAVAHEGALTIESQVGKGTVVHLFLPRAAVSTAQAQTLRVDFVLHIRRVLLVEDDDLVAAGMKTALEAMMLETYRVPTGAAAAEAVEMFHPDVVVLDYGLPDMTGGAVYSQLRARWPNLPMLFATGHADAMALRAEIGNDDVQICYKPFEITRLLEAISAALAT